MTEDHDLDLCVVCLTEQKEESIPPDFGGIHQICPRCGEFKISDSATSILRLGLGIEKRTKLSGWVSEQNRLGEVPMITTTNIENIIARPLPSVFERATYLLQEAEKRLEHLGDVFNIGYY